MMTCRAMCQAWTCAQVRVRLRQVMPEKNRLEVVDHQRVDEAEARPL